MDTPVAVHLINAKTPIPKLTTCLKYYFYQRFNDHN